MDNRSHFRSLDELIRGLDRERALLKEMFAKRKMYSFRYDFARELASKKEVSSGIMANLWNWRMYI